jgi:hypothetical protein
VAARGSPVVELNLQEFDNYSASMENPLAQVSVHLPQTQASNFFSITTTIPIQVTTQSKTSFPSIIASQSFVLLASTFSRLRQKKNLQQMCEINHIEIVIKNQLKIVREARKEIRRIPSGIKRRSSNLIISVPDKKAAADFLRSFLDFFLVLDKVSDRLSRKQWEIEAKKRPRTAMKILSMRKSRRKHNKHKF